MTLSACLKSPRRQSSAATGPLSNPTPAVEPQRREPLNLPFASFADRRTSVSGGVESGCGAVAVGWAYLFPPRSSGGALDSSPENC
jgi:hypothetical protein